MSTERVRFEEFLDNLEAIFERVLAGDEIVVERADGELVTLKPGVSNGVPRRRKKAKNLAALRAAAGSWSDVDTD